MPLKGIYVDFVFVLRQGVYPEGSKIGPLRSLDHPTYCRVFRVSGYVLTP